MSKIRVWLLLLLLGGVALAQRVARLAEIEANPRAFENKEVLLLGYFWPWFEMTPLFCRGLPIARGNQARTRSDPLFCDGTRVVFVWGVKEPLERGPLWVVARVEPVPAGFRLWVLRAWGRARAPAAPPARR